jgi:hypothetical protein
VFRPFAAAALLVLNSAGGAQTPSRRFRSLLALLHNCCLLPGILCFPSALLTLIQVINTMADTFGCFSTEVMRVLVDLRTGKLGSCALVDGAQGTWYELTQNVNVRPLRTLLSSYESANSKIGNDIQSHSAGARGRARNHGDRERGPEREGGRTRGRGDAGSEGDGQRDGDAARVLCERGRADCGGGREGGADGWTGGGAWCAGDVGRPRREDQRMSCFTFALYCRLPTS